MQDSHAHLDITETEWAAFMDDLRKAFAQFGVPPQEERELIAIVESTKKEIVR
jgi:hemoglobin